MTLSGRWPSNPVTQQERIDNIIINSTTMRIGILLDRIAKGMQNNMLNFFQIIL